MLADRTLENASGHVKTLNQCMKNTLFEVNCLKEALEYAKNVASAKVYKAWEKLDKWEYVEHAGENVEIGPQIRYQDGSVYFGERRPGMGKVPVREGRGIIITAEGEVSEG